MTSKEKRCLGREGEPWPLDIVKNKGNYIYTSKKKYLDFLSGWCVGNSGWDIKEIQKSMRNFKGPEYVLPEHKYQRWEDLAKLLAEITPEGLVKSFRATGGTEAVEIALQAAMIHTKRTEFVSVEGAYHGHSIGAMSVGNSWFKYIKNLMRGCHKINPPLDAKAGREVEKILKTKKVAAYISEPIICNLGAIKPTQEYFDIVSAACKKYGTLFISDEVASGFGRTGKMFGCEHYNIKPDIITMAKGITSGYGGLGATIMTKEVAESMEFDFSFYSTFGWLPICVEGAIANINYILKNKLWKNAEKMGKYFAQELPKIKFKSPVSINVTGLAIGMKFDKEGYSKKVWKKCLDNGLITYNLSAGSLVMYPALDIDKKTADKALRILSKSV